MRSASNRRWHVRIWLWCMQLLQVCPSISCSRPWHASPCTAPSRFVSFHSRSHPGNLTTLESRASPPPRITLAWPYVCGGSVANLSVGRMRHALPFVRYLGVRATLRVRVHATCDSGNSSAYGLASCLCLGLGIKTPTSPHFTATSLSHDPHDVIDATTLTTRDHGDGRLHDAEDDALFRVDVDHHPAAHATKGRQELFASQGLRQLSKRPGSNLCSSLRGRWP